MRFFLQTHKFRRKKSTNDFFSENGEKFKAFNQ